jgi:hypothetical protein
VREGNGSLLCEFADVSDGVWCVCVWGVWCVWCVCCVCVRGEFVVLVGVCCVSEIRATILKMLEITP